MEKKRWKFLNRIPEHKEGLCRNVLRLCRLIYSRRHAGPKHKTITPGPHPHELNNLYNNPAYAQVANDLKAELHRIRTRLGDTA